MNGNGRKIGVLLLNLGGPDSLRAVRPFLFNLFSDRKIIRLGPAFLQKPLAFLISTLRAAKTRKAYALIGGKSPLNELTLAQAKALEIELKTEGDFRLYMGMRYWHPFISETLEKIKQDGIKKLIVLTLYPHYSLATTGSSMDQLEKDIQEGRYSFDCSSIGEWPVNPFYIEAIADTLRKGLEDYQREKPFVLFSAHGLPMEFVEKGDPYPEQIKMTIKAVAEKAGLKEYGLSYQSRTGPVQWLKPYTDEKLRELAREGIKRVLMVPVSFVSDHVETLYEIDLLYKELAIRLGLDLRRTEALNTHPLLIKALGGLILDKKKELGW